MARLPLDARATRMCCSGNCEDTKTSRQFKRESSFVGATAAQALIGRAFRVTRERGKVVSSPLALRVVATVHPSSILRAPDEESRSAEMRARVGDLRRVAKLVG